MRTSRTYVNSNLSVTIVPRGTQKGIQFKGSPEVITLTKERQKEIEEKFLAKSNLSNKTRNKSSSISSNS